MQGIFQKENTDKALKYGIYRHLPTYEKIIRNLVSFYKEIFGLDIITKQEGNVILTEGLVLQDAKVWADVIEKSTTPYNNMTELYFEDNDVEGLVDKLISRNILVEFKTELTELASGQKMVRFYDPSGNLIEVRTPVKYS
ncbi:VOC family protein [[Ruminococcus] lactaris]|uniref:VOC family protein n=1 Tax=[Ruminococcus] lactaris TaxID=46228 RepID=UPI0032BF4E4C